MYRYWHHYLATLACPAPWSYPCLHPLPLGPPVLEPDLHLDLTQPQVVSYLRSLRQAEVLLAVELLLQLQQLLAGEGCPPPPGLAVGALGVEQGGAVTIQQATKVTLLITRFTGVTIFRNFCNENPIGVILFQTFFALI